MNIKLTKEQAVLLVMLTDDATRHGRLELRSDFEYLKILLFAGLIEQIVDDKTAARKE